MTNLKNVLVHLDKFEKYGSEYYNVMELKKCLDETYCLEILQDVTLIPFYITPNGRYEIYDYELNARVVKQSNRRNYLLGKTGKTSLEEIDKEVLEKLDLCYVEIVERGDSEATAQIKRYVEHLLGSPHVRDRIPEVLGRFKKENLYFEVYFY